MYIHMSVLETFVTIRRYRARAAGFQRLADGPFSLDVRDRYLSIANHYFAMADAELLSDKLRCKERLEELRYERDQTAIVQLKQPQVAVNHEAPRRAPETFKLRVIHGAGARSANHKAASSSRLRVAAHLSILHASVAATVRKHAPSSSIIQGGGKRRLSD
jgi:hypothetical protein